VLKTLKTIRFKALNTVAREVDRLIVLKTSSDANRGAITNFDIIEDCTVSCKIPVKDRKGPFKIYVSYGENNKIKPQSGNLVNDLLLTAKKNLNQPKPDLKVHVSE
jgi:hypothetical protein